MGTFILEKNEMMSVQLMQNLQPFLGGHQNMGES
jgi:hypothetical protein